MTKQFEVPFTIKLNWSTFDKVQKKAKSLNKKSATWGREVIEAAVKDVDIPIDKKGDAEN